MKRIGIRETLHPRSPLFRIPIVRTMSDHSENSLPESDLKPPLIDSDGGRDTELTLEKIRQVQGPRLIQGV